LGEAVPPVVGIGQLLFIGETIRRRTRFLGKADGRVVHPLSLAVLLRFVA
jgi:hypothetical protein